jgi:hypothetical protein
MLTGETGRRGRRGILADRALGANGEVSKMLKRALLVGTHHWMLGGARLASDGLVQLALLGLDAAPFEEDADLSVPARGSEDVSELSGLDGGLGAVVENLFDFLEGGPAFIGVFRENGCFERVIEARARLCRSNGVAGRFCKAALCISLITSWAQ